MKLLITIFCPSLSKSYDFWIPSKIKVEDAIEVLCSYISEFETNDKAFYSKEELLLYSYMEKKVLFPSYSLGELGVKSGDRLALL